jgi:hypothetical protein
MDAAVNPVTASEIVVANELSTQLLRMLEVVARYHVWHDRWALHRWWEISVRGASEHHSEAGGHCSSPLFDDANVRFSDMEGKG